MSESKEILELEARVVALEYLLKHCLWNIVVQRIDEETRDDPEVESDDLAIREARLFRKNCIAELKNATFQGAHPAMSDHLSALVHDHVERVVGELVQEMEAELGGRHS